MKNVLKIIVSLGYFLIIMILTELGLRIYFALKIKNNLDSKVLINKTYGWVNKSNYHEKTSSDEYGEVFYSTKDFGFRVFGDIKSPKTKILVIGDSYTAATTVSDGKTYYDYIKNLPGVEVFAYGTEGYGTLQEYLILKNYYDIIKPDIIIWEFCQNDLIDNDPQLEFLSLENNSHLKRPYYENNQITYSYPYLYRDPIFAKTKNITLVQIIYSLLYNPKIIKNNIGRIEDNLYSQPEQFSNSIETTSQIMKLVKEKTNNIPVIAFSTGDDELFESICNQNNIKYIRGIYEILNQAEKKGQVINFNPDLHWNQLGHKIVGEKIIDYLYQNKLMKK